MAIFLKVNECCPFLYHPVLEIYCQISCKRKSRKSTFCSVLTHAGCAVMQVIIGICDLLYLLEYKSQY